MGYICANGVFQSTLPVGGATCVHMSSRQNRFHFNPRSPWGERLLTERDLLETIEISIHAPRGGSDLCFRNAPGVPGHFNPRSPWGERPQLSVGRDDDMYNFNPRSPWGERLSGKPGRIAGNLFQSTLPVGGATGKNRDNLPVKVYFNPRSPWGERPKNMPLQRNLS